MRLDKYVSQALKNTRSQARKLIRQRRVCLNESVETNVATKVCTDDKVAFDSKLIYVRGNRYLAVNKPAGYICSTQNEEYPTALNLIKNSPVGDLHFAGRLDVDTTGLVLVSDDGQWTHRVTSPRKHYQKVYRVITAREVDEGQIIQLTQGVELRGEDKKTAEAEVLQVNKNELLLTITEGRYHQVKRMLAAVGNHVELLHREKIGSVSLDGLGVGEWRELSPEEISGF